MLWTGFILGLVGSLHCAGMCGPLALAVPTVGSTRGSFLASRLTYNAGRIATYAVLGAAFGLAGESLRLAGVQQWLSIGMGSLLLAGLLFASVSMKAPAAKMVGRIKSTFASLLRVRTFPALFALGATNGLLPCGLVYVAAAAAAATGHLVTAVLFMAAFGLGTTPMMIGLPLLGRSATFRFRYQKLVPVSVFLVGTLLILRGMALGIPYISPVLEAGAGGSCPACH